MKQAKRAAARSARERNVGDEIIEGLKEAIAFERGELSAKVTRRDMSEGVIEVAPAPEFEGRRIARLRERLQMSQPVFAKALNVSAETVKSWEQYKREPDGAALRLLEVAEQHPEWLLAKVRDAANKPSRKRAVR